MGDGERRQLTVLFCDLVGSTALASAMDIEDLHELMLAYQRFSARCIEDARGFVARFAGDGVLAYFGYPIALEDAPRRAIHAAVHLRAVGQHLPSPAGLPLEVRVGIATGVVVVGDLIGTAAAQERAVAGITPNLAARLQALAAPGSIIVSDTTKHLAEGMFEFRALGEVPVKGFSSPVRAFEVMSPRQTVSRYWRGERDSSPFVGRKRELAELLNAWQDSRLMRRRVVGIIGDPGMGKSRLLEEARQLIDRDSSVLWLQGGGASIFDNTPFHVVAQFVSESTAKRERNCAERGSDETSGEASQFDLDAARIVSLLSGFRSPDFDGNGEAAAEARSELMHLLVRWMRAVAERAPTVLAVEDLHWADPSTIEFLDLLMKQAEFPLLILYTSRVNFAERWSSSPSHCIVLLESLDDMASSNLARAAAGDRLTLPQLDAIVSKATGVPLYVEELARLIAGRQELVSENEIPSTLADLLAARLEELGPVKRLAQIAAVLGEEFSADLFGAMVEPDHLESESCLADLCGSSVILPSRSIPDGHYVFRHALIAAAAYSALLKRQRRELHWRAAVLIVERFPELARAQPELLARHWAGAGDIEKAATAWNEAGDLASRRHAFREAEHAYREILSAFDEIPGLSNDQLAMNVNAKLARVLQITQGYSSEEADRISRRAGQLATKIGDDEALSRQKRAKWRSVFTSGDYAQAEEIAKDVINSIAADGDAEWRQAFALRAGIQQGFYTGDLARGERDFIAWNAIQNGSHRGPGDDVLSAGIGALIAYMTGSQAIAAQRIATAFAIATRNGNQYDVAMALHVESCVHHFTRDFARQKESAARLVQVAGESGFEYAGYLAGGWLAVAHINFGNASEAIDGVRSSISGFQRLGARVSMPFWLGVLGRAYHLAGDLEKALETYSDALNFNRQERAFRPEVILNRAHLLGAIGRTSEAERDLRNGARLAAAMGAASYQLRLLIRLGRLHMFRGNEVGLGNVLRSMQPLLHQGYCAADLRDSEALLRNAEDPFEASARRATF